MRYSVLPVLMTILLPLAGALCLKSTDTVKKRHYKATMLGGVDMTTEW